MLEEIVYVRKYLVEKYQGKASLGRDLDRDERTMLRWISRK
jgi:hypothetical protein